LHGTEDIMAKQRRHLGEILYKAGLVEKQALINAIKASKTNNKRLGNKRLGEVLLELGLINEDMLTKVLAKQFGLRYVNIDKTEIPNNAASLVPQELMKKHNVLPLGENNGKLKLIISDPTDLETMDAIRFRLNRELECYLGNPTKIRSRTRLRRSVRKRMTGSSTVSMPPLLSLPRPATNYRPNLFGSRPGAKAMTPPSFALRTLLLIMPTICGPAISTSSRWPTGSA